MTTPSKAIDPKLSVSEMIGSWGKQHDARAKKDAPPKSTAARPQKAEAAAARTKRDAAKEPAASVACPKCGDSYSKRARWVLRKDPHCYRCADKEKPAAQAASTKKKGTTT